MGLGIICVIFFNDLGKKIAAFWVCTTNIFAFEYKCFRRKLYKSGILWKLGSVLSEIIIGTLKFKVASIVLIFIISIKDIIEDYIKDTRIVLNDVHRFIIKRCSTRLRNQRTKE